MDMIVEWSVIQAMTWTKDNLVVQLITWTLIAIWIMGYLVCYSVSDHATIQITDYFKFVIWMVEQSV